MQDTFTVMADGECFTIICTLHQMRLMFTAMSTSDLYSAIEVWLSGNKIMDSTTPTGVPT